MRRFLSLIFLRARTSLLVYRYSWLQSDEFDSGKENREKNEGSVRIDSALEKHRKSSVSTKLIVDRSVTEGETLESDSNARQILFAETKR